MIKQQNKYISWKKSIRQYGSKYQRQSFQPSWNEYCTENINNSASILLVHFSFLY